MGIEEDKTIDLDITGNPAKERTKTIEYPFEHYIVKVELTETNKFIGINEIIVNTSFLSFKQKLQTSAVHDIEEYYKEEEDIDNKK